MREERAADCMSDIVAQNGHVGRKEFFHQPATSLDVGVRSTTLSWPLGKCITSRNAINFYMRTQYQECRPRHGQHAETSQNAWRRCRTPELLVPPYTAPRAQRASIIATSSGRGCRWNARWPRAPHRVVGHIFSVSIDKYSDADEAMSGIEGELYLSSAFVSSFHSSNTQQKLATVQSVFSQR